MGDDWTDITLGDFITFQRGFDLPKKDRTEGPYPVIASTGHVGTHNQAMVTGPGLVIGRSGSLGGGQYIDEDFWPLNTTLWVKDFNGNSPLFCYYFSKSIDFTTFNVGSGVPTLNRNHIHPLPVHVPPLIEQRAIAHILGSLDDKIELNRRMNQTLEAMARAIFKSWFVDFDPVWENVKRKGAKAQGRKEDKNNSSASLRPGVPALPFHILDLFPDSFEDSGLGETPKGWEIVPLPKIIDVNPKRTLKKGQEAPYLEMKNMPENSPRALDWYDREFGSGVKFMRGDTLMARITPCLENGKGAYVDFLEDGEVGWGSTEYIVFRAKKPLPSVYSYFLSRTADFRSHAIVNMTGSSGRQRVPASIFKSYIVTKPSKRAARIFGTISEPFMEKIKKNDEEARTLASLRDTLLPKLISGELRVPDAEKFLEKAGL